SVNPLPVFAVAPSFNVSWAASDPSGIVDYQVRSRTATSTSGFSAFTLVDPGAVTHETYHGTLDTTVCFSARAEDGALHTGPFSAERCTSVPIDDRGLTAHAFTRVKANGYFFGTYSVATASHATLTSKHITALRLAVLVTKCPTCGRIQVTWNGTVLGTFSL